MDELELKRRVSERTGLFDDKDISAYLHFCHHAGLSDGIILYDDVRHEFYRELVKASDSETRRKEKVFWERIANHKIKLTVKEAEQVKNGLSFKAKKQYEHYLEEFIEKGLILSPIFVGRCTTAKYPVLIGYNYFNDPSIYKIESTESGERRTLIQ